MKTEKRIAKLQAKLRFHHQSLLMMLHDIMNGTAVLHSVHFAVITFDLSVRDLRKIVKWLRRYDGDCAAFAARVEKRCPTVRGLAVELLLECLQNSHIVPAQCAAVLRDMAKRAQAA